MGMSDNKTVKRGLLRHYLSFTGSEGVSLHEVDYDVAADLVIRGLAVVRDGRIYDSLAILDRKLEE